MCRVDLSLSLSCSLGGLSELQLPRPSNIQSDDAVCERKREKLPYDEAESEREGKTENVIAN